MPWSNWRPPTFKDYAAGRTFSGDERRALRLRERANGNHAARCPCRRVVAADVLLDVRGLPPAVRAALGIGPGVRFVCDACRERWFTNRKIARAALFRALGAPDEFLQRMNDLARIRGELENDP